MKVQVLTMPGCMGCAKVKKMLDEMAIKYTIVDITKNPTILTKYQVMSAPGIIIDGKLEFSGVPTRKQLEEKLKKR